MRLLTAGVKNGLEVTFDSPSLFVGLQVFTVSGGVPTAQGAVLPMANVPGSNTYLTTFTPVDAIEYLFLKRVYTDDTYTTLDDSYQTGSESGYSDGASSLLASVPNPFDVTYDAPDLFVGLKVYDITTGSPVAVGAVIAMENAPGSNTYVADFSPQAAHAYLFLKQVYTSGALSILDPSYSPASECGYAAVGQDITTQLAAIEQILQQSKFMGILTGWLYLQGKPAPQWPEIKPAQIIQGGKAILIARVMHAVTMEPVDITGAVEVTCCFLNNDGTELSLSLSAAQIQVLSGILGKLQVNLTAAQAAALAVVDYETLEFAITIGATDPFKVQIPAAYSVIPAGC